MLYPAELWALFARKVIPLQPAAISARKCRDRLVRGQIRRWSDGPWFRPILFAGRAHPRAEPSADYQAAAL